MYGWAGTVLRVDLSTGSISREPLSEKLRLDYLGGRGINSRILYDEVKAGTDPLGPDNKLIFGVTPLTGAGLIQAARCHASAKSPLTGILGDSNVGGHFGPEVKWAGYDNIILEGKADRPVYLWIDDEKVEIRDAVNLWGKTIPETYQGIWDELGDPRIRITAIGPAGENLVRFACIVNDFGSAFGKTGTGAVMGSKNLKAIAVRGTKGTTVAKPDAFKSLARDLNQRLTEKESYPVFSRHGTSFYLPYYNELGMSVERNGQKIGDIEYIDKFGIDVLEKYHTRNVACFGCIVHCKREFKVKKGVFEGLKGHGSEFCILSSHGPACGNSDISSVFKINNICNEYGVCGDTSGMVLAAAFEWYEKGLITDKDTDGIPLTWGNSDSQIKMLHKIINREGFGDVLADGSVRAAKKIGKDALKYITHAKGGDIDAVDLRATKGCTLAESVSSRGGDPQRGWPSAEMLGMSAEVAIEKFGTAAAIDTESYESKGLTVNYYTSICTMADTLGFCKFHTEWLENPISLKEMADLFSIVTGVAMDKDGLSRVADRINNVERAFLVREGIRRKDDTVHGKIMEEPVPTGIHKGKKIDKKKFAGMLDDYYEIVGWDKKTGIPKRSTLESLGLHDVADDMDNINSGS
ncbi:MAG: aldehyde ferredoxin oxidoreductase family protein [Nitrospina sp.]|jgi:aldehyde:ferredoxin oxidoreductase|nr:aldehyde ferredoxin oxidoreductase family protein [Nitrospina sp.]